MRDVSLRVVGLVLLASFLSCGRADVAVGPGGAAGELAPVKPGANDWPWWRGIHGDNIAAPGQNPPLRWSNTQNVAWQVEVPGRGHGSPCLWGERIFLPTADEDAAAQYLVCYDRATGQKRWQTELHRNGLLKLHRKNSHASATPACDGRLVFMPCVAQDAIWLSALTLDGQIAWQKRLGAFQSMHGFAASPAIYGSLVIQAADNVKESFLAAVHRGTGEPVWKVDRPSYRLGTYASPIVGRVAGRDQLLLHGPMKVFSYNPLSGATLWTCDGPSDSAASTMSFSADLVYSSVGYPRRNMLCIRGDGQGDVTRTHVAWDKKNRMAYVPSLLLADGLLYMIEDNGDAACFDAARGAEIWKAKLEGQFSSSPVLAGDHIFVASEEGVTFVLKAGRRFEVVAKNDLADGGFATPVICGGRIYLRTLHRLYCLGTKGK